jgi:hypothetical protein
VSSIGGTAGIKAALSDLTVTATGYMGKGLGTTLMFSALGGGPIAANGTAGRKSDGGYVQLMYKVGTKTNVGASWGFSRLVNDQTGDGNTTVRSNLYSYTVGVYHQWTKSLKFVAEGSNEGTTGIIGIAGSPGVKMINLSAGFMLFF